MTQENTATGRPVLRIYIYSRLTEKYAFTLQKIEKVKIIFANFSKAFSFLKIQWYNVSVKQS